MIESTMLNMVSLAILICVATIISPFRVGGKLQNENLWNGRKELRELDDGTLFVLQHEFEHFQQEFANNDTLLDGLAILMKTKETVIERLERKIGMKLPYWDYRIDNQLIKPEDSSILLMELCRNVNEETSNNTQEENILNTEEKVYQQTLDIEQRCKSGALLSLLRQTIPSNSTFENGCSQCETESSKRWLFCDPKISRCISKIAVNGNCTTFARIPECCYQSTCQHGYCTQEEIANVENESATNETYPDISENATIQGNLTIYFKKPDKSLEIFIPESVTLFLENNLTLNINDSGNVPRIREDFVENSTIHTEISHLGISGNEDRIPQHTSPIKLSQFKNLSNYYQTNVSNGNPEADYVKKERPLIPTEKYFDKNQKSFEKENLKKPKNKEKIEIDKVVDRKYPESRYFLQRYNSSFRKKKFSKHNYYRKSRKFKKRKEVSKLPKSNAHLYGHDTLFINNDPTKSFKIDSNLGRKLKIGPKRIKLLSKKQRKAIDDKFYLPTAAAMIVHSQYVYFSITVIEGEPKRNSLLNRATTACNITLTGANMPYGFTEKIKGQMSQETTSVIMRTLNPELFGPLVEFNITVIDKHGHLCQQKCLSSKEFYEPCEDRPIRLSSHEFIAFSDPIEVFETQNALLENQWTGRGYYRKRKRDFLLFTCDG